MSSSSLLDERTTEPATRLRATMAAVRLSFMWFGVRKSLSAEQKSQAADTFGAEGNYLSAGKKLFDTSHPAFRAVTAVRSRAVSLWRGMSVPYPEPGIRLIRQDDVSAFDVQMTSLRAELQPAQRTLNNAFDLAGEFRASRSVIVGVDLDLHVEVLVAVESDF